MVNISGFGNQGTNEPPSVLMALPKAKKGDELTIADLGERITVELHRDDCLLMYGQSTKTMLRPGCRFVSNENGSAMVLKAIQNAEDKCVGWMTTHCYGSWNYAPRDVIF